MTHLQKFSCLVAASFALTITPALKAQQPPPPPAQPPPPGQENPAQQQRRQGLVKEIMAQIGLTDEQRDQIKNIMQGEMDPKERRQAIIAVLTPEQKQKFRELMQAKMAEFRQQQGNGNNPPPAPNNNGANQTSTQQPPPPAQNPPPPAHFTPYDPKPVQPLDL